MSPPSTANEDTFVNVWVNNDNKVTEEGFYDAWLRQASAKHQHPSAMGAEMLRKEYPNHSMLLTNDYALNFHGFPSAQVKPMEDIPLLTNLRYISLGNAAPVPGILLESVEVGGFDIEWEGLNFLLFTVTFPLGFGMSLQNYVLHKGPETNIRSFFMSLGNWTYKLHNEIYVFDQGFWRKDPNLWYEVQKADWKDIILKEEFKKALQKDVYGFFDSRELYAELGIPWKRGLIMHGPPGNGKTISLKAIMKTCDAKGYAPLYVKSFQSFMGDEVSMTQVFNKAREVAPCVLVLEDLDSLITDRNRSFFLNQLDGLEGNDGLLVIGTTNHFDRLDPGISTRPSRFDRKYLFDDPDRDERALYAQYWQNKLKHKSVDFPDSLVEEIAEKTSKFSFAYLKETFVSTLVLLAGMEDDDKPPFRTIILEQIDKLRKQLDKPNGVRMIASRPLPAISRTIGPQRALEPEAERDFSQAFRSLTTGTENGHATDLTRRWFSPPAGNPQVRDPRHLNVHGRNFRHFFDQIVPERRHFYE
ncbi:P-loop containing nucleoside triphosphate hydrolase protein [Marasmius fiardii PR-910]|nr:P-loop containing nucleoside triphosphate hydrolase protein [Marasmius fiardii PR-910]